MSNKCVFCDIIGRRAQASIALEDEKTLAFMDRRQANPGHVLVIPKTHINDVRDLDDETGSSLMKSVSRIAKAVSDSFPNDGLSVWHSIGSAAFQEISHLHIHVHPRIHGDGILRVYQSIPKETDMTMRDRYAALLQDKLQ